MRMNVSAVLVVAALVVGACESSTRPGMVDLAALAQREAQWQGQELHDYSFEYHYEFAGAMEAVRITVRSDTVASVVDLQTDSTLSLDARYGWPTVDSLFARARQALASTDVDVVVSYDSRLGYPTRIDVSPLVSTPAGGSSSRASDLQPLG